MSLNFLNTIYSGEYGYLTKEKIITELGLLKTSVEIRKDLESNPDFKKMSVL